MDRGFRAEYAVVEAICMPESGAWATGHRHFFRENLREFARYHEIAYFDTFGELQEKFPPQDVSHLINPRLGVMRREDALARTELYQRYIKADWNNPPRFFI